MEIKRKESYKSANKNNGKKNFFIDAHFTQEIEGKKIQKKNNATMNIKKAKNKSGKTKHTIIKK